MVKKLALMASVRSEFIKPVLSVFRQLVAFAWIGAFLLLTVSPARAQLSSAAINGTIRDTTGAAIIGAQVTLRETSRGTTRTTQTNSAGNYVLIDVAPGNYTLDVVKDGFATAKQSRFVLHVNQTATFNFALTLGSVEQQVTVSMAAAQLETSTSNLGTVLSGREVNTLPLNGRNFTQLLLLTPGASRINTSQQGGNGDHSIRIGSFSFPAMNGQPNRSNLYLLDGITDQSIFLSEYAVQPIVDAIAEFKVQSHNDEAQFGGVLGGVVNVVTKSGTNQFHGNFWEFIRNDAFDASDPIVRSKTPLRQNVYGATIGGPVMFPYYNGRNHTFFFGAWEGTNINSASHALYNVPTVAELAGDFSAVSTQLYNPYTTRPDPNKAGQYLRTPFANNNIASALDPTMVTLAKALFPAPAPLVAGFNGEDSTPNKTRQNNYSLRLDQQITQSNLLWARLSQFHATRTESGGIAGLLSDEVSDGQNWGAGYIHTFGSSATVQLNIGHVWHYYTLDTVPANPLSTSGFNQSYVCGYIGPRPCQVPVLAISGYASGGPSYEAITDSDIYVWGGDITKLIGRHLFQTGANFNHTGGSVSNANGGLNFSAIQTSNLENQKNTGDALASFLIGAPTTGLRRSSVKPVKDGWVNGVYISDQWKVTPKLTMNMGLRYDWVIMPVLAPNSTQSNITGALNLRNGTYILTKAAANLGSCDDLGAAPCIPGGALPAHVVVGNSNQLIQNQLDNIEPRFGLAYQIEPRLVLHLGYARVYDDWSAALQYIQGEGALWPSFGLDQKTNLNATTVTASAENPLNLPPGKSSNLPSASPFTTSSWVAPYIKNPYSDQWTVGIQQQFGSTTMFTLNYAGSRSRRLECCGYYNVALTPGPGTPMSRAPFTYIPATPYAQSNGYGSYNALQAQLGRKVSSGLSYTFNYTWSKTIDLGCDGYLNAEGCFVREPYNPAADRSVAGYDLPNMFTGSVLYQLPFGGGQKFQIGNRIADAIVGGWQVNAIATLTSGTPFTISYSGDVANTGNKYQGVDLVGNPKLAHPTLAEWFNTAAFQAPATYTYGNVGRNTMRSDWYRDLDLSIFRKFSIERVQVEFRAEAFNATNTPVWGHGGSVLNTPSFGRVASTYSTPRELQFAGKIYF